MITTLRGFAIALACLALWCAAPVTTHADIPNPKDAKPSERPTPRRNDQLVTLQIEGSNGYQGYLYVPASMLTADAGTPQGGMSAVSTAVSGVALSLSLVFGGLWLARSRKRLGTQATVSAACILAVLAGTATYALANASPYPLANSGTLRRAAPPGDALQGQIRLIRVTDGDPDTIRLVLPREE